MPSIFDSIQQQVANTAVQQITQRFGIDPAVAQQTVNAAIPVITGAIASHARSGGAQAIHREATNQASSPTQSASLPQVFGDQHSAVEQRVSDATGISREDASAVISAVAPAILRGIGQHVQQQGIDAGQLSEVLNTFGVGASASRSSTSSGEARM
jgi:hypothetical protein